MESAAASRLKEIARLRGPEVSNTSAKVLCFSSSDAIARRSACSLFTE